MALCQPACPECCLHVAPLQVMHRLCTALYPHLDISKLPDLIRQADAEAKREANAWATSMVDNQKGQDAAAAELEAARRRRLEAEAALEEERRLRVEAEAARQAAEERVEALKQQLAAVGAALPGGHP